MVMNRKAALAAGALVGVAFVVACSDSATEPAKVSNLGKVSFAAAGSPATSTPVASEFRVCKDGNTAGTFIVSTSPAGGGFGANHTAISPVTIQPGTCVVVAEDDAASGSGSNVTVTESPATNLTGVAGVRISTVAGITTIANPTNGFSDFINSIHGVRLTFTNNVVSSGCTFTQGYYKNHESYVQQILGPGGTLNIGTIGSPVLLTAAQIDANLETPPKKGDAYFILTHQLITAELNILGGGSAPPAVQQAIADANALLADNAISAAERDQAIALAAILDDYNNGLTGPGHCE
jgi:hypothetical protein